jgi:hypothetical protein
MRLAAALGLAAISVMLIPAPAPAQVVDRMLVIYGDDPCPTNKEGDEIVVCQRRPEGDRYRIPKELRPPSQSPENQSWAARSEATLSAGAATGAGSCSSVGPAGWTGCWAEQMRQAKRERKEAEKDRRDRP